MDLMNQLHTFETGLDCKSKKSKASPHKLKINVTHNFSAADFSHCLDFKVV